MKNFLSHLKSFNFAKIIDLIFFNVSLFLIFFAWTKFIFKRNLIALILTFSIIIAINIVKSIRNYIKSNKNKTQDLKKKDIENCMLSFLAQSDKENLDFFLKVFSFKKIKYKKKNFLLFENNEAVCFDFSQKLLSSETCLKHIHYAIKQGIKKLGILCYSLPSQDKLFFENLKNIQIKIYEKTDIYTQFLSKYGFFPEKVLEIKSTQKLKIKQIINISLDRKKSKAYFFSGILIFFCSLIVRYNIYYVIMSSILFFMAILCRRQKEEIPTNFF